MSTPTVILGVAIMLAFIGFTLAICVQAMIIQRLNSQVGTLMGNSRNNSNDLRILRQDFSQLLHRPGMLEVLKRAYPVRTDIRNPNDV